MSGEGYRTLLDCKKRSQTLRAAGFSYTQIATVLALDHNVSPLRLYRYAHGHTARRVADDFGQLDPAATATLRETRLYDYETWPTAGRRPPAWTLAILARIYHTQARHLITDQVYATYRPHEQDTIDRADHRHLDPCHTHEQPPPKSAQQSSSMEPPDHVMHGLGPARGADWRSALASHDCERLFRAVCAQEADVKRRDVLLQLALTLGGTPALTLLRHLTPDETERLAHALRTPGALDRSAVAAIEKLTAQCWQLDDTLGARGVLPIADAQLVVVTRLLQRESLTPALRGQILAAHWHLSHLAGWVHFDTLDHDGAVHRYTEGLAAAHELGDSVALAHLHGCLANVAAFRQQPSEAIGHIYAARGWAKRSNHRLQRAATATMTARVIAFAEKNPASLGLLDQATDLAYGERTDADPLHLFWCTPARVSSNTVRCLVQLNHPNEAIETSQRLLAGFPLSLVRERADLVLETTPALIQKREISAAANAIAQAATMADRIGSARLMELIRHTRSYLDPWAKTSYVRDLDEKLRDLRIVA